ncbi:hypothetical protein EYF80_019693 [Liparis tanakae]|uniref:Uncharacterized protein n=1 Tax=Liparis tanakae TaxID=230148 RepID=A0A4Z2HWE5_9TELE|nr:hypothetical protein EYF80_019693 [Liparis tanakae]
MGLISIPRSLSLSPCLKNSSMILSVHCRYTARGFVGLLRSAQCTMFLNTCAQKTGKPEKFRRVSRSGRGVYIECRSGQQDVSGLGDIGSVEAVVVGHVGVVVVLQGHHLVRISIVPQEDFRSTITTQWDGDVFTLASASSCSVFTPNRGMVEEFERLELCVSFFTPLI